MGPRSPGVAGHGSDRAGRPDPRAASALWRNGDRDALEGRHAETPGYPHEDPLLGHFSEAITAFLERVGGGEDSPEAAYFAHEAVILELVVSGAAQGALDVLANHDHLRSNDPVTAARSPSPR